MSKVQIRQNMVTYWGAQVWKQIFIHIPYTHMYVHMVLPLWAIPLRNPYLRSLRKKFLNIPMNNDSRDKEQSVCKSWGCVLIDRWELSCLSIIQYFMNICFDYCNLQKPGHIPSANCLVLFCRTPCWLSPRNIANLNWDMPKV